MNAPEATFADIVILGGGTAGLLVAQSLLGRTDANVLVVEAGPDYGPLREGAWPADLLDSGTLPTSHDWGYSGPGPRRDEQFDFDRARVLGGCSSHNGCSQTAGVLGDYEAMGLDWTPSEIEQRMASVRTSLRVTEYADEDLTPFQRGVLEAMVRCGIPRTDDLGELMGGVGCGPSPVNIVDGVRWNSAFAFLDDVRQHPRLSILARATVDRVVVANGVVDHAVVHTVETTLRVHAGTFILSAGTYGSPEILLRSGIGPAGELATLGIPVSHDLPGVGRNLHDHPSLELRFAPSDLLVSQTAAFSAARPAPDEQVIAKADSLLGDGPFDMHVYPWTDPIADGLECVLPVAALAPRSRGALTLRSSDPAVRPRIDHAYLSDEQGHDRSVLGQGMELCDDLAASAPLAKLLGPAIEVGVPSSRYRFAHYWHPVGTCAIGSTPGEGAVTDTSGRVFGTDNLFVMDASVLPNVPRATTNLPVLLVAGHLVDRLISSIDVDTAIEQAV